MLRELGPSLPPRNLIRFLRLKLVAGLLPFVVVQPAWAATTVILGTDPTKTVLKGTLVTADQVLDGELVIDGDTITCVAVTCAQPSEATVITVAL